jgi:RNA polymerase sigma factor (sigma-70 family)
MAGTWRREESTATLRALNNELFRWIRFRTPQTADADDLLSNVWEATCKIFEGRCTLRRFLYIVAVRQLAGFRRRNRVRNGLATANWEDPDKMFSKLSLDLDLELELDASFARRYGAAAVAKALPAVREPYRGVIELRLSGYSYQEIAALFDITYHTARSRTARGKQYLIDVLVAQGVLIEQGLRVERGLLGPGED